MTSITFLLDSDIIGGGKAIIQGTLSGEILGLFIYYSISYQSFGVAGPCCLMSFLPMNSADPFRSDSSIANDLGTSERKFS
jgi:hypothetical protein